MRLARLTAVGFVLFAATNLAAQQASAPSATGETGLFTILDGWTLPKGEWSFGFYYNNWDRLVAPVPGGVVRPFTDDWDYDWNRLSASAGYGISDRFELSLMVPYDDFSASDNRHKGYLNGEFFADEIDASGIGNVRIGAKYQLFGDVESGETLALNAFVEAPTGENEGVSTDDTGFGVGLNWNFSPNWVARLGYRDPGDPEAFDVSTEIEAGLGYAVALNDRFDWITELAATLYQGGDSSPDDAFDLATGGRYWIGEDRRWAVNFALRTELSQLSDTDEHCPIGGLVGLTMMPRLLTPEQIAQRLADREAGNPPGTAKAAQAAEAQRAAAQAAADKAAADKAAADKAAAGSSAAGMGTPAEQAAARKAADEAAAKKAAEEAAAKGRAEEASKKAADEAAREAAAAAARQAPTETINFGSSSDRLTNIAKAKLDEVALRLKQNPAATALIVGGADAQGGDSANQSLGLRRAQSAKSYLVSRHQIDGSRIAVESRGSADPVASNDTGAGREQNRRAIIIVRL